MGDWGGGVTQVAIGVLLAILARQRSGRGQSIDISITDGIVGLMKGNVADYLETGVAPEKGQTVAHGGAPYNDVYRTKEGNYISIGCWEPWLYENLCRAIQREDLLPLQHAKGEKRDFLRRSLDQVFLTRTRDEWFEFLKDRDVCVGPVKTLPEMLDDPQVRHRRMVVEVERPGTGKVKQIGIGIKLTRTPGVIRRAAPVDGQDTDAILKELGYTARDIRALRQQGAVG